VPLKQFSTSTTFLFATLLALAAVAQDVPKVVKGTVTANRLNVRARAGQQFEQVCQIKKGIEVDVVRKQGVWLGIKVPADAVAWIASTAISDGAIVVDKTPVYSGASTLFSTYGFYHKGDKVAVKKTKDGVWSQVTAPYDGIVWIHGDYVSLKGDLPDAAATDTAGTDTKVEIEHNSPTATEPDLDKITIHKIKPIKPPPAQIVFTGEPKPVERKGMIIPLGEKGSKWAYALAIQMQDTYYPTAYLKTDAYKLEEWKWEQVNVVGVQKWMSGWPRPLIEVKSIEKVKPKAE
jgi:uncharacterized protein YraI